MRSVGPPSPEDWSGGLTKGWRKDHCVVALGVAGDVAVGGGVVLGGAADVNVTAAAVAAVAGVDLGVAVVVVVVVAAVAAVVVAAAVAATAGYCCGLVQVWWCYCQRV